MNDGIGSVVDESGRHSMSAHLQRHRDVLSRDPGVALGIACRFCFMPELRARLASQPIFIEMHHAFCIAEM